MSEIALALIAFPALLAIMDWRRGFAACLWVGVLQDPLRKLEPSQPVYFVLLVGVVFGLVWLRAQASGVRLAPSAIQGWRQTLGTPFGAFTIIVTAQALHSFARYGSVLMTGIGLLVWLAPVPAIVLAYQFALRRGLAGVRTWLQLYCALGLAALVGVYLEYAGVDWRVLGEVGAGLIIYDVGTTLRAYSGLFRSSEIAAWHTAAIACFIFLLSINKRATALRVLGSLAVVAVLLGLGILTGRRKLLVEVAVFFSVYLFLVLWLQRGAARLAAVTLVSGLVTYVAIIGFVAPDAVERSSTKRLDMSGQSRLAGYAVRGQSVFADVPARVSELGVKPLLNSMEYHGIFGAGLGTGSQGVGQVAEQHNISQGVAEGGLGKMAMELGLPGVVVCLWLVVAFVRHVMHLLVITSRLSQVHTRIAFALLAFLAANVATFSIATQAYSDVFILLMMGCAAGFLLAMPVLAQRHVDARERARTGHASIPVRPARHRLVGT